MRAWTICTVPYVEEALEAERRIRRGDRQRFCDECERWHWPEHTHFDEPGQ